MLDQFAVHPLVDAGLALGQVEVRQFQTGRDGVVSVDRSGGLERAAGFRELHGFDLNSQGITRGDKRAVFHVTGFLQHGDGFGKSAVAVQQPCGRLRHRLQHQNSRKHGKRRKMIRKILLGQTDILDRHQSAVRNFLDPVDQIEFHQSGSLEQGFSDGVGRLQGRG